MDWSGEWWVLILGPGLVILVVGILYFTRSRAFRFRSAAAQVGLIGLQGLHPISDEDKKRLNLFSRGSGRKITNFFGDRVNSPSQLLFDFSDSVGPSQASAPCTQTVAAFAAPVDGIPDFQLTSSSAPAGAQSTPSRQPIRLDSPPDFERRYSLCAANESAVRSFFNSSLLDRLTAFDREAFWTIEKAGRWLLIYRHDSLFPPQAIPETWQQTQALANLFLEPR